VGLSVLENIEMADLCSENFFDFHMFSFCIVFNHDFIVSIDFIRIAASDTATEMTSQISSHMEYATLPSLPSLVHGVHQGGEGRERKGRG